MALYTEDAGRAIAMGIPVKYDTAHGRSITEVGSAKCIDVYGSGGVSRPSLLIGNSKQKIIANTDLLRPIQHFYSLTVCS